MRVLHVYRRYFPDPFGGIEESIRQIALTTKSKGVETRIFTLSPEPIPIKIVRPEGIIYRSKSWISPASCNLGGIQAFRLFAELSLWADIIHYHFPWPFADLLNLTANKRVPSVVTYHSDIVRQKYLKYLYMPLMKKTLKSMDAIIATSQKYVETSHFLSNSNNYKRLEVIPLGIDKNAYENKFDQNILNRLGVFNESFFLFIGILRYYKGLHILIKAARKVNAKVIIVGSGPKNKSLKNQVKKNNQNNIIFSGELSESEKLSLLKNCLAFILPSHLRSEAYGMVLVEASLLGKPMISCEIGTGTSFINLHNETGFVIQPENPDALAKAMNMLLRDSKLVRKFGQNAKKRYQKLFSGSILGQAYSKLYNDIKK